MESLYVVVAIVALAGLLIYSMANRSASWLRIAQVIFYSIVIALSTIIFLDASNLNKNFFTSDNTILLRENGNLLAGIRGRVSETPEVIDRIRLGEYQGMIDQGNLATIRDGSYRLFIFDLGAFWGIEGAMKFGDTTLTRDEAVAIIRSQNALDDFANLVIYKRGAFDTLLAKGAIKKRFASEEELKAKLFSVLIAEATRQQSKAFVPMSYRNKELRVDPRTPYFMFIEYAPSFIVDLVVRRG